MKILRTGLFLFLGVAISSLTYASSSSDLCSDLAGTWGGSIANNALALKITSQEGSSFSGTGFLEGFNTMTSSPGSLYGSCTATGSQVQLNMQLYLYEFGRQGAYAGIQINYNYNYSDPDYISGNGSVTAPGVPYAGPVILTKIYSASYKIKPAP